MACVRGWAIACAASLLWTSFPTQAISDAPARSPAVEAVYGSQALSAALLRVRRPLSHRAVIDDRWAVNEWRHWRWREGTPMLMLASALGAVVHVVNHWAGAYLSPTHPVASSDVELMIYTWYVTALPLGVYVAGRSGYRAWVSSLIKRFPVAARGQETLQARAAPVPRPWTWKDRRDWIVSVGGGAFYAIVYFKAIHSSPTVFVSTCAQAVYVVTFLAPFALKRFRGPEWRQHLKRNTIFFLFILAATTLSLLAEAQSVVQPISVLWGGLLLFFGVCWILGQKDLVSVRGREREMDVVSFTATAALVNAAVITLFAASSHVTPWSAAMHLDLRMAMAYLALGALNIFRFMKSTRGLWPRSLSTASPSLSFAQPSQVVFVALAVHLGLIQESLSLLHWLSLVPLIPGIWLGLFERSGVPRVRSEPPPSTIGDPQEPFDRIMLWLRPMFGAATGGLRPDLQGPLREALAPAFDPARYRQEMNDLKPWLVSLGPLWDRLRGMKERFVGDDNGTRHLRYFPVVPRQGSIDRGLRPYDVWSVADHTALTVWIALYLARRQGATPDQTRRILAATLFHDTTETITKDTTPMKNPFLWAFHKKPKEVLERLITPALFLRLPPESRPIWRKVHFDLTEDPFIRTIVKDSDKLAGVLELLLMARRYPNYRHAFLEDLDDPAYTQWGYTNAQLVSPSAFLLYEQLVALRNALAPKPTLYYERSRAATVPARRAA